MPKIYPGNKPSYGIGKSSLFLFLALAFPYFVFAQPVISSFSPAMGPTGTQVTITGSNFSSTPSANTVFFGTVKATVSAATPTSLTVTVPVGASYQPLTVTTGGLMAFSALPFDITFFDPNQFTTDAFAQRTSPDIGNDLGPQMIFSIDLDGDGKPDLVTANADGNTISIYKNTGAPGTVSFVLENTYPMDPSPDYPVGITAGDLDGDGKPEIVVTNIGTNTIAIFRNTSVPGTISIASPTPLYYPASANTSPVAVTIGDLNGDGKPEIITACPGSDVASTYNTLTIYANNSSIGNLSFSSGQDLVLPTGSYPAGVVLADLDGDGKPDLATENLYTSVVSVFRNTSVTNGAISFVAHQDFPTGTNPKGLAAADLDGDGKIDLVAVNSTDNTITLLRNTSTAGTLSFDPGATAPATGNGAQSIGIADLDGDGKPDLAVTNITDATISVFRNTSTAGTITVANAFTYPTGNLPQYITIADLDGDGKPDLATSNNADATITVLRNHGAQEPVIRSFTPATGSVGMTITIIGNNFTGATSVSFGDTTATAFTVLSDTAITATVGAGASGAVVVITPAGLGSRNGFLFTLPHPSIHSFTPVTGPPGTKVSISGTGLATTSAISFGGTPATSFGILSDTLVYAFVGTGSTGKITLTASSGADSLGTFTFIDTTTPPPPPPPTPLDITSFSPSTGQTGTVITITGIHLLGATTVSFGGTPARSITVASDTVIYASVGTGSSGQVSVTGPNGTDTLNGFTYIQPTRIVYDIVSFSPVSGTTGAVVTIQGDHFSGATSVTFGGTKAAQFTVTNDSTIVAIIGTGASGQVKVSSPAWQDSLAGFTYIQDTTHSGSGGSSTQVTFELLQFSGTLSGDQPLLQWIARNDKSIFYYVVERGTDSTALTVLTSLQPDTKDPGNHSYSFTDPSPRAGANFYRLKMVDTSGTFTYSSTIKIQAKGKTDLLSVYPNPVKYGFTQVDIPAPAHPSHLQVLDMTGKVIKSQDIDANIPQVRVNLPGLLKGTYKLIWTDGANYRWATILVLQ